MREITIKPTGNSMLPFIRPNDTVSLICDCRDIKKYDVVLYQAYGVSVLHRVIGEENDRYIICGDNTAVIEKVPKKKVAAKAVKIERHGRMIDMNKPIIKLMLRIWYELRVKRAVRKINKMINKTKN